jgi:hypothetical protein
MKPKQTPSCETLALIAAHLLEPCRDIAMAANRAAALWDACDSALAARKQRLLANDLRGKNDPNSKKPDLPTFPATLNDFYRIVVNGKNQSISESRFKSFLDRQREPVGDDESIPSYLEMQEWKRQFESRPDNEIQLLKNAKTPLERYRYWRFEESSWSRLANEYLGWWEATKKAKKSDAGTKGAAKRHGKNQVGKPRGAMTPNRSSISWVRR